MLRHLTALCMVIAALAAFSPAAQARPVATSSQVRAAICSTFGRYCSQALRVAWCESRDNIYAQNGQYLGLFQMGSYARARYGHSWNAWGQAHAAYRYFRASGYRWTAWECQPY